MRVHVVQASFAELDEYWKERERMEQDNRMPREGDRVRLRRAVRVAAARHRAARTVPAGATGLVVKNAGSLLRIQFSDADAIDEALVSAYDVTTITEPDE